jgi:hypothetical protein
VAVEVAVEAALWFGLVDGEESACGEQWLVLRRCRSAIGMSFGSVSNRARRRLGWQ